MIKNLKQLSKLDIEIAGGKGASLGEMVQAGFPVPPGFVILSDAFNMFLEKTDLNIEIDAVFNKVDIKEIHTVENASKKIQAMILSKEIPEDIKKEIFKNYKKLNSEVVAVRSSATSEDSASAAWAGQLESYLNTTKEVLLENVKKCWASLFTPRAIFYRFEKKLDKEKISVAVIIQKMVDSEVSGVAFSVHPVTEDKTQIIIEAGFGLGEAIVSGSITPDSYVVEKEGFKILDININKQTKALYRKSKGGNEWKELGAKGTKQALTKKEIVELSKLIVKIEDHYGFPCDIEWAKEKKRFYIVQSRPITTLHDMKLKQAHNIKEEYNLHFSVSGFSILTLDMMLGGNNAYGAVDYLILYANDIANAYLSEQGWQECYDFSKLLLDDTFFKKLLCRSKKLDMELKKYKIINLDDSNINIEWKKNLKLGNKFSELYRFYEQPFQRALENHVLKFISEEKLIGILSGGVSNISLDPLVRKYLKRLIIMGKTKLDLHKNSEKFYNDDSFIEYVSKKNNLPINLVVGMRLDEFESAMNGKMIVNVEEIKNRLKGSVFVKRNGLWNLYTGERYSYWKNKIQKIQNKEIKGNVAFPGIVTGKVVLHLSWSDVTNIEDGCVLVSGMTNPQMIPMLKKAIAIVTDEGGITCHAAIISRELNKPCIVGTKNATQILKNGDLVEVDANKGIVRILERAKKEEN